VSGVSISEIAGRVQKQLHKIYEIETGADVGEFLVTDPEVVSQIEAGQPGTRDIQEKLLVRDRGDELDLALYIDPQVGERLAEADPTSRLDDTNFGDYLVLLEGVSHFTYLAWNAQRERPVTLLELELQAEVDKYVSCLFQLSSQDGGRVPRRLKQVLFDGVVFDEQLDDAGLERYETANRVAMKYCARLEERFLVRHRTREMIDDVRRFYRLPQEAKLRAATDAL